MNMKLVLLIFTAMLFSVSVTACKYPVNGTHYTELNNDYRVTRPLDEDLIATMQAEDVQVIQQGSRLQLILPIDKFFKLATTQMKSIKVPTLNVIALYLHNYTKHHPTHYPIKIYAYTDDVPMHRARDEYSNQYAQVVAAYLWSHGFTPQQMSVVGYGAKHPIADTRTPAGSAYNRRVVIQVN